MKKGSAVTEVIIFTFVIVFIILPLFSYVLEKSIIINKAEIIRDAIDLANISVFSSIDIAELGKDSVYLKEE